MEESYLRNIYTADFETTTDPMDLRVWCWGLYSLENDKLYYDKDIHSFIKFIEEVLDDSSIIYFHNLKFDGEFIFYYLFKNGFKHTTEKKMQPGEFSTLISNMGVFYAIKICFGDKTINIYDSLKLIPMSVSSIPKAFNMEMCKGEIDYHKKRKVGYTPTEKELDYLEHDVKIVAEALKYFYEQKLDRMTIASNALFEYKTVFTKKKFERYFPILDKELDSVLRLSYKGGVTQVKKDLQGKDIGEGVTLDVNSLYPYVMYEKKLPYGSPVHQEGEVILDKYYNLSIQRLCCSFKIKKGFLPTIQIKKSFSFKPTEYLEDSAGEDVVLTLTSVDLELFLRHYDVYNIKYIEGWKFKSSTNLFKDYIDKWIAVKNESTISGNSGMRTIAKLMLNSLYGKFGLSPDVQSKYPCFENDVIKYKLDDPEERNSVYVPIASFITSYARDITMSAAQANYDRFIYCDTDSIHLVGSEIPNNIWVDQVELGAWKVEQKFSRARFLRAKSYIEEVEGKLDIKCAGLPNQCKDMITYENFKFGLVVHGKLQQKREKGGVYLKEIDFTIDK